MSWEPPGPTARARWRRFLDEARRALENPSGDLLALEGAARATIRDPYPSRLSADWAMLYNWYKAAIDFAVSDAVDRPDQAARLAMLTAQAGEIIDPPPTSPYWIED